VWRAAPPTTSLTAVGLPIILGIAGNYVSSEVRAKRTGQAAKATCPPHPAFSYIWMAASGLTGYAAHLTVRAFDAAPTPQTTEDASNALLLYYAQLGLQLLWEPLFVGQNQKQVALANSVALLGTAATMAAKMNDLVVAPISTNWFTVPYCAWIAYTTYLNARVVLAEQ
jgi:benzodiazapine receptor